MLCAVRETQLPLIAALLLCGSAAKLIQLFRTGVVGAGTGPVVLFPTRLRGPLAIAICVLECGVGAGLIVTASERGTQIPTLCLRLAASLLFVVATCALIELRASRADVGCGCFGDLSTSPVTVRSIARSAILAVASLVTIALPPLAVPKPTAVPELVMVFVPELLLLALLSPEIGEALIRLGYSEPCELHDVPVERTVSALHRSKQWRRNAALIASDLPVDVWRELCWRYLVYPSGHADSQADVVFAVSLRPRAPAVRYALVHRATGQALPLPARTPPGWRGWTRGLRAPARVTSTTASGRRTSAPGQPDLP
jgi:hypothetical protein